MSTFDRYLAGQQSNLEQLRRLPHFTALVDPVISLYERAAELVPKTAPPIFGRLLLLSHRNLLSAATLMLRALPDDAAAVTRRAVEAARVALAIKYDPANLKIWIAFEKRNARWKLRYEGETPKPLRVKLKYPPESAVFEKLGTQFGMLSDSAVHFTPEFLEQQAWRTDEGPTPMVHLNYFIEDIQAIELGLLDLGVTHALCLQAFDECYAAALSQDANWARAMKGVWETGRRLAPAPDLDGAEEER